MKKLLFLLCLALSTTLFYSCGDDDNNDDPQTETEIVQNAVKGKFYKTGIEAYQFTNNAEVDVWTDIVEDGKYYHYQKATFKVYPEKQYIVIKTTSKEILLYYRIENGKVYLYTDADKINNISNTNKPNDLTEESKEKPTAPIDPNNIAELKAVLQSGTWTSTDKGFFEGTSIHGSNKDYKTIELDFNRAGKNTLSYGNEKTLIEHMPLIIGEKFIYYTAEPDKRFFAGFEVKKDGFNLHYTIQSITYSKIELTYEYKQSSTLLVTPYNNKITLVRK